MQRLTLAVYSGLMRLAQPLLRRKMAQRAIKEPGYGVAVEQRFGHYTQPRESTSELVWLHAVSLGETRSAAVLVHALRAEYPGLRILLSHGTATGHAEGLALLQPDDVQVWQPWDTRVVVERFFEHFKPRLGLLMETEVWPCTLASAKARSIPMVLVNARLSEKSLKQALSMSLLAFPAYRALAAVFAQTASDAKLFKQLGVDAKAVFGNLKFDAAPSTRQQQVGQAWRQVLDQPVVMFASSREGEEILFLEEIVARIQQRRVQEATDLIVPKAQVRYLLVPRHPQRFDEVAALVVQHGLTLSRRSSWSGSPLESIEAMQADIWLGDTLGEMPLYYALSDAALLGGSFEKLGGQNLIEAAACGCPVVMGPHTFNFSEAAELSEAAGAALRVVDMASAVHTAITLVSHTAAQSQAASSALAFSARHQGATGRTLHALAVYLG